MLCQHCNNEILNILFYLVASILGATAVDFGGGLGFFFVSSSVASFFFLFSTLEGKSNDLSMASNNNV
jgi:hypothetical protein